MVLAGVSALSGLVGCSIPFAPSPKRPRPYRIGVLVATAPSEAAPNVEAFRQGLRESGYVEGENLLIEFRVADGRSDRLPELAAELVRLEVDVIVAGSNSGIRPVQQATHTIPIVFTLASDPVESGIVASLARPGGNLTGVTQEAGEESAKRLELLKEAFPGVTRVAVLGTQQSAHRYRQVEIAAEKLGVQLQVQELERPDDLDTVLAAATAWRADGLLVVGGLAAAALTPQIVEFAARNRLPAMYYLSTFARAGGLLFYGASAPENYHRAATYVDKILKGAKPADLPVEQPTNFDFVVNLKTAQALGFRIPESVLAQATELIQ